MEMAVFTLIQEEKLDNGNRQFYFKVKGKMRITQICQTLSLKGIRGFVIDGKLVIKDYANEWQKLVNDLSDLAIFVKIGEIPLAKFGKQRYGIN